MLDEIKRVFSLYCNKLYSYIVLNGPPGSLQLTGILGLAALVLAYYQLKRNDTSGSGRRAGQSQAQHAGAGALRSATVGRLGAGSSSSTSKAAADSGKQVNLPAATPLGRAVRSKLVGIRKVTISSLGPLTEEWSSNDLQEGASLRSKAVDIIKEVCACADTYIITQVQDDVGQAVVAGSLEAAGLIGSQPGQVKPHHLLFCSTLEGKVSIVRQIEPDLHIDGSARTIEDLKRFMPQLLHIPQPGTATAGQGSSNVISSSSLAMFFEQ
eukprot:GHRR01003410.1.p2 GENE.GHRR01003410.1~~GHRR01003410.1.p2  ORF type:complete len:268 (+),score=79.02 GHRR01003410.1:825-1628(+)